MEFQLGQSLRGIYRTRLDRYQQTAYFINRGALPKHSRVEHYPAAVFMGNRHGRYTWSRHENCGQRSI